MNAISDTGARTSLICKNAIPHAYWEDVKEIKPKWLRSAADTSLRVVGCIRLLRQYFPVSKLAKILLRKHISWNIVLKIWAMHCPMPNFRWIFWQKICAPILTIIKISVANKFIDSCQWLIYFVNVSLKVVHSSADPRKHFWNHHRWRSFSIFEVQVFIAIRIQVNGQAF